MGLPNGHALALPMALLAALLLCSPMGRCAVPLIVRCIHKNGVPPPEGSIPVLYSARIGHCRPCPLRSQCQESHSSVKPRPVSAVFLPLSSPPSDSSPPPANPSDPPPLPPV